MWRAFSLKREEWIAGGRKELFCRRRCVCPGYERLGLAGKVRAVEGGDTSEAAFGKMIIADGLLASGARQFVDHVISHFLALSRGRQHQCEGSTAVL
jgi:hypothetical protein